MSIPVIPNIKYAELQERFDSNGPTRRIPLTASVELTFRCNLRCAHCYINRPAGDAASKRRELSRSDWRELFAGMADHGCLWLLLTGGEPFLRPDLRTIYMDAKRQGLLVTLFTNATLLTPGIVDWLCDYPPYAIEVTLYGRSRETYERVTGAAGSYDRCMAGIELLAERGLPLKLKTMVLTLNRHELADMKSYAAQLGVEFYYDAVVNARLDGGRQPLSCRLTPQQVVDLDREDPQRSRSWLDFCKRFREIPVDPDKLYDCGAGVTTCNIDPYGRLSACGLARTPSYDLTRGSFSRGWDQFLPGVLEQKWRRRSPCRNCELSALCNQCPAWAQLENHDAQSRVPYLCEIAHLRWSEFGKGGAL